MLVLKQSLGRVPCGTTAKSGQTVPCEVVLDRAAHAGELGGAWRHSTHIVFHRLPTVTVASPTGQVCKNSTHVSRAADEILDHHAARVHVDARQPNDPERRLLLSGSDTRS